MNVLLACTFLALAISKTLGDDLNFDILQIISGNGLSELITCDEVQRSEINFLLYTRNNNNSIELNSTNIHAVSSDKKFIVIIHGWIAHENAYGMQDLKNAYLKRYDCNLVIIDWKKFSHQLYSTSVCKLPKIANHVANLLVLLKNEVGLLSSNIHLVGHSLGGQMSGLIGQEYFRQTNEKVDRITGLDPAGPLFADVPKEKRIDSTDAVFVDILHTNGGVFGYYGKCGTADFFINCGTTQHPRCYISNEGEVDIKNIEDLGAVAVACSHMSSFNYMIETIEEKFEAIPCSWCPLGCPPILSIFKEKTQMGEDCDRNARGGYFISM